MNRRHMGKVGAAATHSVPAPGSGLPRNSPAAQSALLVLRNVGSNAEPAFAQPEILELSAPGMEGTLVPHAPHLYETPQGTVELLVGAENGLLYRFRRLDDAGVGNFWLLTAR